MTPEVAGLLMGLFAAVFSAFLYWGGFQEQKRINRELSARRRQ